MSQRRLAGLIGAAAFVIASPSYAGAVYLTGHDPDYHAQGQVSGQHQLTTALNFVTGGTYNAGTEKFLWVESHLAPTGGHRRGSDGLTSIGVGAVNYDLANAAEFLAADLSGYSAIVVASSFGGMLTSAEIDALVARKNDIKTFVNSGGGLAAFAECGPGFPDCDASNVNAASQLFGFVPVGAVSVGTAPPYTLTPFGLGLGLVESDVDDCCTHNSFGGAAGLNIVDFDTSGHPTTLAGVVRIGGGGFEGVPEPSSWALVLLGFGALGVALRRRSGALRPT
jgi:hypothetical protein